MNNRPARWLTCVLVAAALPALPARAASSSEPLLEFTVIKADTLIGLSREVLTEPGAWREVARLNRLADPNRILPGQVLLIPARLMRVTPVAAKLASRTGEVRLDDRAAAAGSAVAAGQTVQTGPNGSAVIELADGSRLRLPPSSLAQVMTSQTLGARSANPDPRAGDGSSGWFSGALRVLRGSVEVFATKVLRAKPLDVVTPTAVVGVRGTGFRVGYDAEANGATRVEVVDGRVRFDPAARAPGVEVAAGYGSATDAAGSTPRVVKLLAPPDLAAVPARFERPLVHFAMPPDTGVLRVQVAADAAFDRVVSDQRVEPGAEVRIAGLDDATWHLRGRRVDAQGLEGFDASRSFVLKARPEPPAHVAPRPDSKQTVGPVAFSWAPNVAATRARFQLSEDAAFTRLLQDRDGLADAALRTDIEAAGTYFWRLASLRPDGDQGPFGDPQRFELRPLPEPPTGGLSADGSALAFAWGGRPQDRQQVQLARDLQFTQIVAESDLSSPEWNLPTPSPGGRYYFRYRSIEPDGFVSPYSSTLMIDVPRDWSGLWLLLPLLMLL